MSDKFKVGYYYKFIGNKNDYYWDDNDSKLILDGNWHKCINEDNNWIKFKNMKYSWFWLKKDFIESKYSPREKVKKLLEEI